MVNEFSYISFNMAENLVLGIDQGSGSSKAVLIDVQGGVVKEFFRRITTTVSDGDRVEQDANELFESVQGLIDEALEFAGAQRNPVLGIGIACQRSGVCAFDSRTFRAVSPFISWADKTSRPFLASIGDTSLVTKRTSLPVTPHYAAPKIRRLQKEFPGDANLIGTLDTYLLYGLTGGKVFATEDSMASRTMLYTLEDASWDEELCELFEVDVARLPIINPSLYRHGHYRNIPIAAMLGDQQASLLGRLDRNRTPVINMGTVTSICIPLGEELSSKEGYVSSILYSAESKANPEQVVCEYILEGLTNASGSIIDLILTREKLARNMQHLQTMCEAADMDSEPLPVIFNPLGGTASPDWRYDMGEVSAGIEDVSDVRRTVALVENIAHFVIYNLFNLQNSDVIKRDQTVLHVSGGLSELDYIVQYIADVSGLTLHRMASREATARGAALAALFSVGGVEDLSQLNRETADRIFEPRSSVNKARFHKWVDMRENGLRSK